MPQPQSAARGMTAVGTILVRVKDGFPRKAPELYERYQALLPRTILYADLSADVDGIAAAPASDSGDPYLQTR